jgi:hypothetical protein
MNDLLWQGLLEIDFEEQGLSENGVMAGKSEEFIEVAVSSRLIKLKPIQIIILLSS